MRRSTKTSERGRPPLKRPSLALAARSAVTDLRALLPGLFETRTARESVVTPALARIVGQRVHIPSRRQKLMQTRSLETRMSLHPRFRSSLLHRRLPAGWKPEGQLWATGGGGYDG